MTQIILGSTSADLAMDLRDRTRMNIDTAVLPAPAGQLAAVAALAAQMGAQLIRPASASYDCWGLVLANRRGWPKDFKDDPNSELRQEALSKGWDGIEVSLRRDGLRPKQAGVAVEVGMIIAYRTSPSGEIKHVGLVVARSLDDGNVTVLSKWGKAGEYMHRANQVLPVYGSNIEFWEWI